MSRKILLIGKNGQIGWELRRTLASLGDVCALGHADLDLCDADALRQTVLSLRPEIVVNAAAYTDVNQAESERELADAVNGRAPCVLAEELKRQSGRLLVHYSTDYVFDGTSSRPYREDDPTSPINAYGASKLHGEEGVIQTGIPHFIFRTEWVYSTRGKNFLLTLLRLAREGKPLRIVSDQVGSPTWARMIAEATAKILIQVSGPAGSLAERGGVYHLTAAGQTSWHGFAEAILRECLDSLQASGLPDDWCRQALQRLTAIPASDYPTPARRPAYSVLDNTKLSESFAVALPDWREELHLAVQDLVLT